MNDLCPVCRGGESRLFAKATDVEYGTSSQVWEYLECACGVIFLADPPVDLLHEIYPPSYYSFEDEDSSVIRSILHRLQAKRIADLLPSGQSDITRIADVGGGVGSISRHLRSALGSSTRSVVIDLDERCRDSAVQNGHEFICSTVEKIGNLQGFQLILLLNVIEHVADPAAVLHQLLMMLDPGGILIVQTPNSDSLDCRLFKASSWGGLHAPRHWVIFNLPNFAMLAKSVGFDVESAKWVQGSPFWAVSISNLVGRLLTLVGIKQSFPIHKRRYFFPILVVSVLLEFVRRVCRQKTSQMIFTLRRPPE